MATDPPVGDSPPPTVIQLQIVLDGIFQQEMGRKRKSMALLVELGMAMRLCHNLIVMYPELTKGADGQQYPL